MPEMNQDTATESIVAVVRELLKGFIHHKRDLKVKGRRMGSIVSVEISGNRDDQPKLVGTRGQHIAAMNLIMRAVGARLNLRIVLSLHEATIGQKLPPRPFRENHNWKPEPTRKVLRQVIDSIFPTAPTIEEHHDENGSIFQVVPDPQEESLFTKDLEGALQAIFDAIGKANGRTVHIAGPAVAESA
jgi:predicted RNA-binding protein YlqC (UPF0109 family)